ncbi:MAG: DUF4115 domain-containing protein [Deltaproteobacteria bacterium]|nr:DUF4115 domain-containing protein [Deltaproteobacteria bacterium]
MMEHDSPATAAGLGEYLRAEREKRSITIEQIASATKISVKLLHALESDNYDALPAKPFVRGFASSYSRYLGIDPGEMLSRFESFLDEKTARKHRSLEDAPHIFVDKEGQTESAKTGLKITMIGIIVIGAIAVGVLKPSLRHRKSKAKEKAAVTNEDLVTVPAPPTLITLPPSAESEEAATAAAPKPAPAKPAGTPRAAPTPEPTPAAPPPTVAAAKQEPAPTAKQPVAIAPVVTTTPTPAPSNLPAIPEKEVKHRLIVRAVEDSWVKYQADDRPMKQFMLKKDKKVYIRARNSIRFMTGNAKGTEISSNNTEFRPFTPGTRLLIIPKDAEPQYLAQPFIQPAPQ